MTNKTLKITLSFFCFVTLWLAGCALPEEQPDGDMAEEIAADTGDNNSSESGADEEFGGDFGEEGEVANNEEATSSEQPAESDLEEIPAEEQQQAQQDEPVLEEAAPETPAQTEPVVQNRVTAINYLAAKNGGTIEIKTSSPANYNVRTNPDMNQYIIEVQNATLADSLKRPFIMKDFEGAFGTINAYQNPGGQTARIVVQMKGQGEPVISQEGNSLLVLPPDGSSAMSVATTNPTEAAVSPAPEGPKTDKDSYNVTEAAKDEKILGARTLDEFLTGSGKFYGRPISIETNDAEVRDVIKFIAEESGVNLVIADDVEGKVSVKLRQVPWDQALVIVMRSRGLGYVRQGNVLRITKLATLQAEAQTAKQIVDSQKILAPMKVKVMPISYAVVADLEKQVKPFLTKERGEVVSDSRTSSLIVTDTADVLGRVERLVKELDIPPPQVMIEGKIVEASENFKRQVGINWGYGGSLVELAPSGGANGTPLNMNSRFRVDPTSTGSKVQGMGTLGFNIGSLDFFGNLDATLSLAQTDQLVRIISSPRIVTMNKEKALISQKGEDISVSTFLPPGSTTTQTTDVRTPLELKLEVTPQITADGSVILDVDVLRQFAGAIETSNGSRPVNSRSAKTKILVPNGQTAVIGGIYQSDETETETGVPVLKDVPVLGWLFKNKTQDRQKNELLLFLTPRILNAKDQAVVN